MGCSVERGDVAVGARPSRTTTSMRRGIGPAQTRSAPTLPPGAPACLPTTKGMADAQSVDGETARQAPVVTGPGRGHADVLFVHPAVHDPDVHELAVRDLADRARSRLVEHGVGPATAARPGDGP